MKNPLSSNIHKSVKGLYEAKLLDAETIRGFEVLCLPSARVLSPTEIKRIRLREKVSRAVFAAYLNIYPSTIKKWETGEKRPRGPSLKLLNLVAQKGLAGIV